MEFLADTNLVRNLGKCRGTPTFPQESFSPSFHPGQATAGTQNAKVIVHPIPDPGGGLFFLGGRKENMWRYGIGKSGIWIYCFGDGKIGILKVPGCLDEGLTKGDFIVIVHR